MNELRDACAAILPRDPDMTLVAEGEVVPCLFPEGHDDDHLSLVNNRETAVLWHQGDECECTLEESCGCIVYTIIKHTEAQFLRDVAWK